MKSRVSLKQILSVLVLLELAFATAPVIQLNYQTSRENQLIVDNLARLVIDQLSDDAYYALAGVDKDYFNRQLKSVADLTMVSGVLLSDSDRNVIIEIGSIKNVNDDIQLYSQALIERSPDLFLNQEFGEKNLVGYLEVAIHKDTVLSANDKSFVFYLVSVAIVFMLSILTLHYVIRIRVMKRTSVIVESLQKRISNPDDEKRLLAEYGDEIGDIAEGVDRVVNTLYDMERSRDRLDGNLIRSEEMSDSILVSTYLAVNGSVSIIEENLEQLNTGILTLLLDTNCHSDSDKTRIFTSLQTIMNRVDELKTVGQNPLESHTIEINTLEIIEKAVKNGDLDVEYLPSSIPDAVCFVDHVRLMRLMAILTTIFSKLKGSVSMETVDDESIIVAKFWLKSTNPKQFSKSDVLTVNQFLSGDEDVESLGNLSKHDLFNLSFLLKSLDADIAISWSRFTCQPEVYLSIPLSLRETEISFKCDKINLAVIGDGRPMVSPSYIEVTQNVNVKYHSYEDDLPKVLMEYDYVAFDGSYYDKAVDIAKRLKSNSFKSSVTFVIILDNEQHATGMFDDAIFDIVIHKPWRISELVNSVVALRELPFNFVN